MNDDGPEPLTIGRLARRTGMPVRTIRYWSDIGALPPAGRSSGGYRLYDAESVARLELIRTLRELGLGLEDVRRVLERETTVAAVAAVQVKALDVQIHTLRLRRAVLSTVAKRQSDTEEMTLLNKLARLSAEERRQIIEEFTSEVFGGVDADPEIKERMRHTAVELPDDPTPEQVDAWVELAELVGDPGFRQHMRGMAEFNATQGREPGAYQWFAKKVTWLVGGARERGVAPDSPEAADVLGRLLGGTDSHRRAEILQRLETGADSDAERYRQLLAVVNGQPPQPSHTPDYVWLITALRAHG
ncbi:MAG: hypothetical protein QOI83_527 [Streptomycetaceae bacterium]|jgi:DNA-binding transcriptional MerR regulator|nr:hypothetical protein [Streptomycetaceae bacterium]